MVFGREAGQPIDLQVPLPRAETSKLSPDEHYSALKKTLASIKDQARSHLRQAQSAQKAYYDQKVSAELFSVGELVLVFNPFAHCSPKF